MKIISNNTTNKNNRKMSDLIDACFYGDLDKVKSILNKCDINTYRLYDQSFYQACYGNKTDVINYLLEFSEKNKYVINIHYNCDYIIGHFCKAGDLDMIKRLIKYGEDNNTKINLHSANEFAFCKACIFGQYTCAQYIIDYYYSHNDFINIKNINLSYIFNETCRLKFINVVKLLIEYCICNGIEITEEMFSILYKNDYFNYVMIQFICDCFEKSQSII